MSTVGGRADVGCGDEVTRNNLKPMTAHTPLPHLVGALAVLVLLIQAGMTLALLIRDYIKMR